MGRFKSVEIEGLLIKDFNKTFENGVLNALSTSNLSDAEILERLKLKFDELFNSYEDTISSFYLDNHKLNLKSFLDIYSENQNTIVNMNKESFSLFILYINTCTNIYERIILQIKRKKIDVTLKINVALYGLVIRRAQEILDMIMCGHIDGAMIIWRSLYENTIVLLVLALENDVKLTNKYIQHSTRSSKNGLTSYSLNHKDLNFPPLSASVEKAMNSKTQEIEAEYGKDFLSSEFGWANDLFPTNQKANFRLLEEKVKMRKFRPYYLLCSQQIHPNFNAFKRFMKGNKVILPWIVQQETNLRSFIDPMQFTVAALQEINEYILYEFSKKSEYNVNLLLLEKIISKQQSTFGAKSH